MKLRDLARAVRDEQRRRDLRTAMEEVERTGHPPDRYTAAVAEALGRIRKRPVQ